MNKLLGGTLGSLFLLALLAACSQNPGTKVTPVVVNLDGTPAAVAAAAYQVGGGEWKALTPDADGKLTFYVPAGETRYGVAVRCGGILGLGDYAANTLVQLTTDAGTAPQLTCFNLGAFAEASGHIDVSGVTGATGFTVQGGVSSSGSSGSTSGTYHLDLPYGGGRDLIAFATSGGGVGLAAKIVRGIDATATQTLSDVTLTNADALVNHSVAAFSVPSGWSGGYELDLYTAGGTVMLDEDLLGSGSETGGGIGAVANAQAGDLYLLQLNATNAAGDRGISRLRFIDAPDLGNLSESLSMDPFSSYSVTAAAHPTFPANHPDGDVVGYDFVTFSPYVIWSYSVSRTWLGGAASYATPDLSALPGFEHAYPLSGEDVSWFAVALKTNVPARDYFELPRAFSFLFFFPKQKDLIIDAAFVEGDYTTP